MSMEISGRARLFGNDINTDYIISSSRKKESPDPNVLKQYLMESVDSAFAASVIPGDLIVSGKNFGCGSAMEIAVTVLLAAGIKAVLAQSFSRTFYRNAVNNGLIPVECDTSSIQEGDRLKIVLENGLLSINDETKRVEITGKPLPEIMLNILSMGGLVPYFRQNHDFII